MMDAVAEELGSEATKRVLARVTAEKVALTEPALRGMPLPERMQALKNWYLNDDPYMDVESTDDGFRLIERNCPFLNTALRRPALCSVSVNALTQLLGVRVAREEKFQDGDGRCVFRAYANEPVDASTWKFRFESES